MSDIKDRIRLAEAMGWNYVAGVNHIMYQWFDPLGHAHGGMALGLKHIVPPINPFTDANDDYAVLEWIRAIEAEGLDRDMLHMRFATELCGLKSMYDYQIGDYARAALKVLE